VEEQVFRLPGLHEIPSRLEDDAVGRRIDEVGDHTGEDLEVRFPELRCVPPPWVDLEGRAVTAVHKGEKP
jgi:hypothetical protein